MKATTLAMALVAMSAKASRLPEGVMNPECQEGDPNCRQNTANNDEEFLEWVSNHQVEYTNRREFRSRRNIWNEHDEVIKRQNRKADESNEPGALRLAHNFLSDKTDQEILNLTGAQTPASINLRGHDGQHHNEHGDERGGRRQLCEEKMHENIDWIKAGKVHKTKDQGYCGSCYSFTAMTVLESMIAIANDTEPVHLAEQQIVDCGQYYDNNYDYYQFGCSGGWPGESWRYAADKGMMYDSNYEYVAYEQDCKYDGVPDVTFDIIENDNLAGWYYSATPEEIVDKLKDGPMSIAFQSYCSAFWYYDSGIISQDDCTYNYLDHVIVLTGYNAPQDQPYENTYIDSEWKYRWRDDNDPVGGCANAHETKSDYWDICEWYEETEVSETFPANMGVWTAVNSWGQWWGKNGLVHIRIDEGHGFQGMNENIEYLRIDNIQIHNQQ